VKAVLLAILAALGSMPALAQETFDGFGAVEPYDDGTGAQQPAPQPSLGELVQPEPARPAVRVKNPVAVFSGIDKITGRIRTFDVYIDETVQFGALQVTPRVCYTSGETDAPRTDAFVEVDEITLDRAIRRIFNGWMFADSPGLNAVEHPVYDVWLKDCKSSSDVPPPASASNAGG
jgi:hypothetical protein